MKVEIKIASIADLEILLPLVRAFHEFENLQIADDRRKSSLITLLGNKEFGGIWIIYSDLQPVGYITLCVGYSIEFGGKDAFIDEFYINPEFRGRGIGTQTLESIELAAKDLDIRAIHLEVARTNTKAHRLYERSNFKTREKYVLMSVNL
ncbi:GNAT family N-acetyltransferase [Chamaesiphon minutus]|uniref:Acetyltransferase n=1 Tax=Chamaesiphon minutus (strain ATCC 27169 / PCC 6605) TaxID=1173020 RepID=K9URY9_CHAP6|nr:GNAT family N-acetyltransferase [Chamaesiphon minutus]AFY97039.1 acetyltransferase [Chamaesiphon minutus PCC 6605]